MSDAYTTLAVSLSDGDYSKQLADIQAWMSQLVPGVDVNGPVFNAMLLQPLAARQAANDQLVKVLRDYSMLTQLPTSTIVDDDLRQQIRELQAREFGLESRSGSSASGVLALTYTDTESRIFPVGTQFSSSGGVAATTQPFILREASEVAPNDPTARPLVKIGDQYVGIIEVTMRKPGIAGNVPAGTLFSTAVNTSNLVNIVASSNFVGGREPNDVSDLANSFFDNRIFASMGPRDQIVGFIRSRTDIGDVKQVGVVGFGDPEMHRDKTRFVPGGGGRADFYFAGGSFPAVLSTTLTATPVERPSAGPQRYTLEVTRDTAPAFLEVASVSDPSTGNELTIVATERGLDMSPIIGEQIPDVSVVSQGTFSRFQTATIRVEDPELQHDPTNTTTRQLQVEFRYQPGIAAAQSLVSGREWRFSGGDTLVRSAIPLYLSMVVRLRSTAGNEVPDAQLLREAILTELYGQPMRTAVYKSDLVAAMSPFIRPTMAVTRIDFYGKYIHPDGRTVSHNGVDELVLPSLPSEQVTSRTMAIYSISDLISFTVDELLGPEIP